MTEQVFQQWLRSSRDILMLDTVQAERYKQFVRPAYGMTRVAVKIARHLQNNAVPAIRPQHARSAKGVPK
jgi:hypothetical protein